jgi:hypothetical protein
VSTTFYCSVIACCIVHFYCYCPSVLYTSHITKADWAQLCKVGKSLEKSGAELEAWINEKHKANQEDAERIEKIEADKAIQIEVEKAKVEADKAIQIEVEKAKLEMEKEKTKLELARIEKDKEVEIKRLEISGQNTPAEQQTVPITTNQSKSMLYRMSKF